MLTGIKNLKTGVHSDTTLPSSILHERASKFLEGNHLFLVNLFTLNILIEGLAFVHRSNI